MALKFLFDECVGLSLVAAANSRGYEAYHVAHRGLAGAEDRELLPILFEEELILVTNNGPDFTALLRREGTVHPGLVVFVTQVRPRVQLVLFQAVLDHLGERQDLINRVVEADVDEDTDHAISRDERVAEDAWDRIVASVRPGIREFELPSS